MACATSPGMVERGASYLSSPDTPSTAFPERLIRPLPKRSIKSRLSQEAADAITYPPSLPSTTLPAYAHYGENGDYPNDSKVLVHHHSDGYDHDHDHEHEHDHDSDHHDHDCPHHHHHCHHDDYDDDLDDLDGMLPISHYLSSSPRSGRHPRYSKGSISGPDGYEAFENTNNKKKRKIPTSGNLNLHHSSMTSEFSHMGINHDGPSDDAHYNVKNAGGNTGLGLQGAGRGRNARKFPGRNPLGVSVNGSNARSFPSKYDQTVNSNAKAEDTKDQGIISAAIANATALLRKPLSKGQENVGVLDQQAKQAHSASQFTFTCETDAKGVTFPEQSLYSPGYNQRNVAPHAQSGATSKSGQAGQSSLPAGNAQAHSTAPNAASANAQGKKPRRRKGDVYVLAARQRRLQQEYNNLQHPPAPEDIWICEFCEYESIFGEPPHALIRQYEIKDRKERRRLAEKRRLLEKAKLKGRKGHRKLKKSSQPHQPSAPEEPLPEFADNHLDQLVDDDGLDDTYDDSVPVQAPVASANTKPAGTGGAVTNSDKAGGGTGGGGGGIQ